MVRLLMLISWIDLCSQQTGLLRTTSISTSYLCLFLIMGGCAFVLHYGHWTGLPCCFYWLCVFVFCIVIVGQILKFALSGGIISQLCLWLLGIIVIIILNCHCWSAGLYFVFERYRLCCSVIFTRFEYSCLLWIVNCLLLMLIGWNMSILLFNNSFWLYFIWVM